MPHQPNAVEVVQKMAGRFPDREIAITLNRSRRGKREPGAVWTEVRIKELRERLGLPDFDPFVTSQEMVSRDEAALRLGICVGSVIMLIKRQILPAEQVVPYAPWWIPSAALGDEKVLEEVRTIVERRPKNLARFQDRITLALPGID